MEFLKDVLGSALYSAVSDKLEGREDIRLVNIKDGAYVKRENFNKLRDRMREMKVQLEEREQALEGYQGFDPERLQAKVAQLEAEKSDMQESFGKEMQAIKVAQAIDMALRENKARNPKAVMALLDRERITVEGEQVAGLSDQLQEIKKQDPYLFGSAPVPGAPNKGVRSTPAVTPNNTQGKISQKLGQLFQL